MNFAENGLDKNLDLLFEDWSEVQDTMNSMASDALEWMKLRTRYLSRAENFRIERLERLLGDPQRHLQLRHRRLLSPHAPLLEECHCSIRNELHSRESRDWPQIGSLPRRLEGALI